MQPNKSILLNALDAANKSSSSSSNTNRVKSIADEKLALIRSKRFGKIEEENNNNDNRNHNKRIKKSMSPAQSSSAGGDRRQALLNETSLDADFRQVSKTTSATFLNTDRRQVQIKNDSPISKRITVMNDKDSINMLDNDNFSEQEKNHSQPKFIVTLNGLNENNFLKKIQNKRTLSEMEHEEEEEDDNNMVLNLEERIDDDELMNDDENENRMDDEDENERETMKQKNKKLIRCTFWPTCDKGEQCPYLHPNKPCSAFPSCTFGQQCHYLHPSCRYDGFCTRLDCPFTHVIKKPAAPVNTTTSTNTAQSSIIPIESNKTNETTTTTSSTIQRQQPAEVVSPSKASSINSTPKITINKIQQSAYSYVNEQTVAVAGGVETNLQQNVNVNKMLRRSAPNVPYFHHHKSAAPLFPASQYTLVNRTTNPASVIITVIFIILFI